MENNSSISAIVNHHDYILYMTLIDVPLLILTVSGVVTNTLSLIVFIQQGVLSDSTTVSLFTLSLTETFSCLFMLPQCVCFYLENFLQSENVLLKNCFVLSSMSATYPHLLCTQIVCWVTMYISIERAICVLFPLKVRLLIKTRVTAYIMAFIFLSEFLLHIPFIVNSPTLWTADPDNNESLIAIISQTPDGNMLYRINNLVESTILTTAAMIIVTVSTVTMIVRLKMSSGWRASVTINGTHSSGCSDATKKTQSSDNSTTTAMSNKDQMSRKDRELVKVVACVTTVFVTCLSCGHIPGLTMYMIPGFSLDGYNRELFQLFYTLEFLLDAINANVSFFFYIKMSSKFKKTFHGLFCKKLPKP